MVDGRNDRLSFLGYPMELLYEHSTFEETAFLLINGRMPTSRELDAFIEMLRQSRSLPAPVAAMVASMAHAHPMDALRTAVSALVAFDPDGPDVSRSPFSASLACSPAGLGRRSSQCLPMDGKPA